MRRSPFFFTLVKHRSAAVVVNLRPMSRLSRQHLTNLTLSIAPGAPPPKVQNALNTDLRPGTSGGGAGACDERHSSCFLRGFSTPNCAAYAPVYDSLSS